MESGKFLGATHDGHVIHDDVPTQEHLFVFLPGIGQFTGFTKLYHLASDRSIFMTNEGWLGCYHGDFQEHFWEIQHHDGEGNFLLHNSGTQLRLYSNSDGRLGSYCGEVFDDQLFCCEDPDGSRILPARVHGLVGLVPTGFRWEALEGEMTEPAIFTDAFNVCHYVFDPAVSSLGEIRELGRLQAPLSWGTARDLHLAEMDRPFAWALEHVPLLRHLAEQGLISATHRRNAIYPSADESKVRFRGNGLRPTSAICFALQPVSNGTQVPLEMRWKKAWHGCSLHNIEPIVKEGLKKGKKNIYLTPSFNYAFCLYSVPDIEVGQERFRIVVEVRIKPNAFKQHGDHYKFCQLELIERTVPLDRLEWEVAEGCGEEVVQVTGLVLKQLEPKHPTLRHDTTMRHGCKALISLSESGSLRPS